MRRKAQPKPHKRRFWRHLTMTDRLNIEKWLGEGMKAPGVPRLPFSQDFRRTVGAAVVDGNKFDVLMSLVNKYRLKGLR